MIKIGTDKNKILEEINQIAYHIILNLEYCKDAGLYHGKTGISIFLFHLFKYTSNNFFSDIGFQLLNEIQSQIHLNYPINYESGLSGIGTGIEYMCQNKLIDGDSDDILEDFDGLILDVIHTIHIQNLSISHGLCGLGKYLIYRKTNLKKDRIEINKKIEYALDIILNTINDKIKNELLKYKSDYLNPIWKDILSFLAEMSKYGFSNKCYKSIEILMQYEIKNRKEVIYPRFELEGKVHSKFGLYDGYAGRGLFLLQKIDKSINYRQQLLELV